VWPPTEWNGPPRMAGGGWGSMARRRAWAGRRRGGMARRFGCFVLVLLLLIVWSGSLVLWLLTTLLGGPADAGIPHPVRFAVAVVLVIGVGAFIYGIRLVRSLGPRLGDLVDAAGRVEAGDYAVRVPEDAGGPGELRGLGRAFNTMTKRLEVDEAQRRRLLADVSHELRTPLAIVQGNLEAIIDGVYPADEAHLGPILEETRVIGRLIEDLRTLSLAEAGTLALHPESSDVGVLIAEVAEGFQLRAQGAGITLHVDAADDLPLVELDPIRIREVVSNLVDNALRYVPGGGTIRLTAALADPADLAITVSDNGPGIPPELLSTAFDRFAKAPDSRGSGLGLAIAKAIVEAHRGTITATSPAGAGTTVRILLPMS
jgi:two-component system sensor histidine kinase BaeS